MGLNDQIEAAKTELALARDEETEARIENTIRELETRQFLADGIPASELLGDLTEDD